MLALTAAVLLASGWAPAEGPHGPHSLPAIVSCTASLGAGNTSGFAALLPWTRCCIVVDCLVLASLPGPGPGAHVASLQSLQGSAGADHCLVLFCTLLCCVCPDLTTNFGPVACQKVSWHAALPAVA